MKRSKRYVAVLALTLVGALALATTASPQVSRTTPQTGETIVIMLDWCHPPSFNEALGPGNCVSPFGNVTFTAFIESLVATGQHPAWRFVPERTFARVGGT